MIFLAQSDTTAGFLSLNQDDINKLKNAPSDKKLIKEYAGFKNLDIRIPDKFKTRVKNSKKITFVVKNKSFRVINSGLHFEFLQLFKSLYSSSANLHGDKFNLKFATNKCDCVVYDKRGIFESNSSRIYKINNKRIMKIR